MTQVGVTAVGVAEAVRFVERHGYALLLGSWPNRERCRCPPFRC